MVRKDRSASGGGVAILIRHEFKYSFKVIDAIEYSSSKVSSADVNCLAPVMLAHSIKCPRVSDALLYLVNRSFQESEFPDFLKISSITLIPNCE
jgi:hypothetical protein